MEGTDLEVDGLEAAEGALDLPAISRALETIINAERLIADEWMKPAVQADG